VQRSQLGPNLIVLISLSKFWITRNFPNIQKRAPFDSLSKRFWLNLQARYDLEIEKDKSCSSTTEASMVSKSSRMRCWPAALSLQHLRQGCSFDALPTQLKVASMSQLIVIGYKQQHRASEVLNELRRRDWNWAVDLNQPSSSSATNGISRGLI
jgi:hypothetical protein